jgi:hypothetical protein
MLQHSTVPFIDCIMIIPTTDPQIPEIQVNLAWQTQIRAASVERKIMRAPSIQLKLCEGDNLTLSDVRVPSELGNCEAKLV